jgi:uncharacterized cupredoxin-like copper-binding protein
MRNPALAAVLRLSSVVVVAVSLVACSGPGTSSASASSGGSATTVNVTLTEFKVEFDSMTVPAGEVTFDVKNDGTVVHEFVVFRTDLAEDALPEASDAAEVDESDSGLESMGEVEDVEVGGSKSFTATLTPGTYVGICNVVGHYDSGMHIHFTVN